MTSLAAVHDHRFRCASVAPAGKVIQDQVSPYAENVERSAGATGTASRLMSAK
jgi:hypothetical protein